MQTVVFLLDENGPIRIEPWGWRAEEKFCGEWNSSAADIASELGRREARKFHVHAVVTTADRTAIVLRTSSSYAFTFDAGWRPARAASYVSAPPSETTIAVRPRKQAIGRSRRVTRNG